MRWCDQVAPPSSDLRHFPRASSASPRVLLLPKRSPSTDRQLKFNVVTRSVPLDAGGAHLLVQPSAMPGAQLPHAVILLICTSVWAFAVGDASPAPPVGHLRRSLVMDKVDINLLFGTPEGKRSLQQLETAPTIAAAAALLLGILLCCAGARFVKQATLGCAFLDGAVGISLVLQRVHLLTNDDDADVGTADWENVASWVCFFLGGTLLCLLVLANAALGRFVVGMTAGLMLALVCNTTFGYRLSPGHPHIARLGLLCGLGALCGLVMARSTSSPPGGKAVIAVTSWIGANAMAWGAGYFIGNYPNGASLDKYRRRQAADGTNDQDYAIPKAWWGYLASTIVCCALGCLIQHCAARHQLKKKNHRLQLRAIHNNYTCAGTPRRAAHSQPFLH